MRRGGRGEECRLWFGIDGWGNGMEIWIIEVWDVVTIRYIHRNR